MRSIYFIESKGVKYYKTDFRQAKDHDDSQHDQDRFLDSLLYRPNRPDLDKDDKYINFWDNTIYGYQTLNDLSEITSTINLKIIHYDHSDKLLKHTDYKQLIREDKINKIIE